MNKILSRTGVLLYMSTKPHNRLLKEYLYKDVDLNRVRLVIGSTNEFHIYKYTGSYEQD